MSVCMLTCMALGQTAKPRKPTAPSLNQPSKQTVPKDQAPTPPPPPLPSNPGAVEFGDEPLRIESIGLTMPLPVGSVSQIDSAGNIVGGKIAAKDQRWIIRIASPKGTESMTTAQIGDSALELLLESYGITDKDANVLGTRGRLISREPPEGSPPILISGKPADRWYVKLPPLEGRNDLMRGFTVIQAAPGQFLTFELLTTEPEFERSRGIYQTTIAAATIADPRVLAESRVGAITAGLRLFENLGTDAVKEIVAANPERWERLYRPSPTGSAQDEVEVAYRRTRLSIGNRTALGSGGTSGSDRQEGFVVEIDARLLDGSNIIDSRSVYFMSFDREEEAWVLTNALRTAGSASKPPVFRETGGRIGKSMTVRVDGTGTPATTTKPSVRDEGYLNQVETVILPRLLIRHGVTAEFGFYAYQSSANTIRLRRDTLDHPPERPEQWRVTSRPTEDSRPILSFFDSAGRHLRTEMPDGSFWEPTDLKELARLWKSKGLPMD